MLQVLHNHGEKEKELRRHNSKAVALWNLGLPLMYPTIENWKTQGVIVIDYKIYFLFFIYLLSYNSVLICYYKIGLDLEFYCMFIPSFYYLKTKPILRSLYFHCFSHFVLILLF